MTRSRNSSLRRPYAAGLYVWFNRAFVVFVLGFAAMLLIAFAFGEGEMSVAGRLGAAAFIVVVFGAFALASARMQRIGADVDESGVTVKGLVGTEHFPWATIAGFDTVTKEHRSMVFPFVTWNHSISTLRLLLSDGTRRVINELNSFVPTWLGTKPDEIARRLEAERPPGTGTG